MSKKKKTSNSSWGLPFWFGLFWIVFVPVYFLQTCVRGQQERQALAQGTLTTTAVVINKKNFFGNSPVSQQFAYSYQFTLRGQSYEGNARDPNLQVGDSILIEYAPSNPGYNRVQENRDKQ